METDCCSRSSLSRGENLKKKDLQKACPQPPSKIQGTSLCIDMVGHQKQQLPHIYLAKHLFLRHLMH